MGQVGEASQTSNIRAGMNTWSTSRELSEKFPGWIALTYPYTVPPEQSWLDAACRQLGSRPHYVAAVSETERVILVPSRSRDQR